VWPGFRAAARPQGLTILKRTIQEFHIGEQPTGGQVPSSSKMAHHKRMKIRQVLLIESQDPGNL